MFSKKTMGALLRSSKLSKTLIAILAITAGAHVVDVNMDKDFRMSLVEAIVAALSPSDPKQQ